ncbi:MFS transporter [Streptomyces sp. MMS24-I2-30]|uniref:MFS transporter n=1 Tax=Streptomyces sp. MMS24-I2-30 TaxID=3351564 RepID=UPI003896969E
MALLVELGELRTVAFGLLAVADSLAVLIVASALTGLAGALFNPAVRAYLAVDAGPTRRVEAFATFNVFYQAGILVGPVAGLALLAWDFRAVCGVAAPIFTALAVRQARTLAARPPTARSAGTTWRSVAADWRTVAANRPFLLFAAAMSGSYLLAFQVYLALPLHARELFGAQTGLVTGAVFAVSALAALGGTAEGDRVGEAEPARSQSDRIRAGDDGRRVPAAAAGLA